MKKSKARGFSPMSEWKTIPWRKLERKVFKLQKRIYNASQRGDVKTYRRLQKTLMKSWSAKCLSVRRVTQDNQGKKTAGVDGVKSLSPEARLKLVYKLKTSSKVYPTRRVWIDKPGKDEKRPLGIPTMHDRALQALLKMALDPEWEARFEPNSYGFRAGRSCQDAIGAIFNNIRYKARYVLDADIAKCFDKINHEALLKKLNTSPTIRRQIRAWLKAGVMDGKQLFPTSEGTPQGGVISPLLANIALHGMENRITQEFPKRTTWIKSEKRYEYHSPVALIRYADDFVILHDDLTVVQRCREIISEWLKDMGLELKPSKTRLTHTLSEHEGNKPGFNFLGFTIRQFPAGKHNSARNGNGEILGFKSIIYPSKEKQKEHYDKVVDIIDAHKNAPQEALIKHLNPIIIGWANYYSKVSSKDTFHLLDHKIFWKLNAWANYRHTNKSKGEITSKYWQTVGSDNWMFASRRGNRAVLKKHSATTISRHAKIKGGSSPYNGDLIYWSTRMGNNPEMPKSISTLLKRQKGKCNHCGMFFRDEDIIERDHIIPLSKGGKDYQNTQLLHRHCHDVKTAEDNLVGYT